ncbi:ATP-binding protein [Nocardiopsis sp. MG754419]|uniref:ATP-binding protein n=1 Tax=Nocardiopsis sp. MG754419 TaxID=2259865 RepID=UPI001BAB5E7B|nr:ATP-binding protein [Nocardiopsis sp. MG754419]MBR8745360.1 ATP-binding protein [Nocardiopsis sp. MG754419]
MDTVFSISLPREAYTVAIVRDMLGALLRRSGLCQECIDDILLSVSEACANAIEHGGHSETFDVETEFAPGWCELRISHSGRVPDMAGLADRFTSPHTPLPGLESESGRGILLMRYLMDEVAFSGEPRTTVILRKRATSCDRAGDATTGEDAYSRFALI